MKTGKLFLTFLLLMVLLGSLSNKCYAALEEIMPSELEKRFSPAELKADLDFMFKTMEDIHPNLYAYTPKSIIDQKRKELEQGLTSPLTRIEFYLKVAPLVASLNEGHTSIFPPSEEFNHYVWKENGLLFPFDTKIRNEKVHIVFNYTEDSLFKPGSEILSINGIPSKEIIAELTKLISGEKQVLKEALLERRRLRRLLWFKYGFGEEFEIEFISHSDQRRYIRKVKGVTRKVISEMMQENKSKKKAYSYHSLPDEGIGIIDLRTCTGDLRSFKQFLKETFTEIKEDKITNLIVDIRENPGGQWPFAEALLEYLTDKPIPGKVDIKVSRQTKENMKRNAAWYWRWMPLKWFPPSGPEGSIVRVKMKRKMPRNNPLRFNGNVYLLIGSYTFSQAAEIAAIIKDCRLGTIVGEETGGLASSYGAALGFTLPNTKLPFQVSSKHIFRPSGEGDGRGILPDYEVKQDINDLAAGIDTVMEFTKKLIKSKSIRD